MLVSRFNKLVGTARFLFSSSHIPNQTEDIEGQQSIFRHRSIYAQQKDKIFASRLLACTSPSELVEAYFSRRYLNPIHHSIMLHMLLSVAKNPHSIQDQLSEVIDIIDNTLDDFDPESLISVLTSLSELPREKHQQLLPLQDRIVSMLTDDDSLQMVNRITTLKLISACKKIDRFEERHDSIVERIKRCLRKLSNSIDKLSTRNLISLVNTIVANKIQTRNMLKAICRETLSRVKYLGGHEKVVLLAGVAMTRNKQMLGEVLGAMGVDQLGECSVPDLCRLITLLEGIDPSVLQQVTARTIEEYERYMARHALAEYTYLVSQKELVNLPFTGKVLEVMNRYDLEEERKHLLKLMVGWYSFIKVEDRLELFLDQLRRGEQPTIDLLRTSQRKSKTTFSLVLQILEFPQSVDLYKASLEFKYLVDLSLRYFCHTIFKHPHRQLLLYCKSIGRLLAQTDAIQVYAKQVHKYIVLFTNLSDDLREHLKEQVSFERQESFSEAKKVEKIDPKSLAVIEKLTSVINLVYYSVIIYHSKEFQEGEGKQVATQLLTNMKEDFVYHFGATCHEGFVTWENVERFIQLRSHFKHLLLNMSCVEEYSKRQSTQRSPVSGEELEWVLQKEDITEGFELNQQINGVRVDVLDGERALILVDELSPQTDDGVTMEGILLQQRNIQVKFIQRRKL